MHTTAPRKKKSVLKSPGKKASRHIRLGLTALVFLLSLLLVSKLLGAVISLNKPFSSENSLSKGYSWGGEGRINVVVKGDSLYLLSADSSNKSLDLVKIPDQAYFDLPFGFGQWKASSIYGLGQDEKKLSGGTLLEKTISDVFGLPIDGYLILNDKNSTKPLSGVIDNIRENPLKGFSLLSQSKSDLSPLEYSRLWNLIHGIRPDKTETTDLSQSNITSWLLLADGSRVLDLNHARMDQFIQENLVDSKLHDEGLSIGVFNGTEHAGLADKAARMISNMGGRVIFTTNFPIKINETSVFGSGNSYTSKRLAEVLAPRCIRGGILEIFNRKTDCSKLLPGIDSSRADINVVVGEDFFLKFNKPSQ